MPHLHFVGLDLIRAGPHVTLVGDIQRAPLADNSIDVLLCIHVLEHVDNDGAAMRELYRILKPAGEAVVSVPLRLDRPTHENPSIIDPDERERLFGERTHVRYYGLDITQRLEASGFRVRLNLARDVPISQRSQFGLRNDEHIFHCRKRASS